MAWVPWWDSPIRPWSASTCNQYAHCADAKNGESKSEPAERGTLVHDTLENLLKRIGAGDTMDLGDPNTIRQMVIEAADAKGYGYRVVDEATDMVFEALDNDIFGDVNLAEDAIGIETGIACDVFEENGEKVLKVIDWHEGWEYDATEEQRQAAPPKPFFRGKIDRFSLQKQADGTYHAHILDYKTSLAMEDEDAFRKLPNGKIYSWLLDKFLRETRGIVVTTFIYRHCYVRYHNAKRGMVIRSEDIPGIEQRIKEYIESRINRKNAPRAGGPFCKYCDHYETCDVGEKINLEGKSPEERITELQNRLIYGRKLQSEAEKEIVKLVKAADGRIKTADFEYTTSVNEERAYDFSLGLQLTEAAQKIAEKGDRNGKAIGVNDLVQVKHTRLNSTNMPEMMDLLSTVVRYKRQTKTAKVGDPKVKVGFKVPRVKEFL